MDSGAILTDETKSSPLGEWNCPLSCDNRQGRESCKSINPFHLHRSLHFLYKNFVNLFGQFQSYHHSYQFNSHQKKSSNPLFVHNTFTIKTICFEIMICKQYARLVFLLGILNADVYSFHVHCCLIGRFHLMLNKSLTTK